MRAVLAVITALLLGAPSYALAQRAYDMETYQSLAADADRSFAQLTETDTDDNRFDARYRRALVDRIALRDYITGWLESGTMSPELVASTLEALVYLQQNMVEIHVVAGACGAAEEALARLEAAGDAVGPFEGLGALRAQSTAAVEACTPLQVAEPEPVLVTPHRDFRPLAYATGGALVAAGAVIALIPMRQASNEVTEWNDDPDRRAEDAPYAAESRADTLNLVASGLLGAGVATVATTVLWPRQAPPEALAIGWTGSFVTVRWTW